ncbi:hypothetical protein CXP34_05785 [Ralstonia mannitolilytica]|nr:hypothetical protein CXP34_05785 [Ralstonia mannitolilytica]
MPADKLGRYITSDLFLKRANEAIAKAVRGLEARGIQPCYLDRKTGLIVGRDRTYRIQLRDPAVQAVVLELFADGKHGELMDRLVHSPRPTSERTRSTTRRVVLPVSYCWQKQPCRAKPHILFKRCVSRWRECGHTRSWSNWRSC